MNLNVKTKLYAGLGFLTLLVVLLWSSGLVFINTLADNSSAIIRNNNRTVTYMQNMEQELTKIQLFSAEKLDDTQSNRMESDIDSIKKQLYRNLTSQQENITEKGEADLTNHLRENMLLYFDQVELLLSQHFPDMDLYQSMTRNYTEIQGLLAQITYLNLAAIQQKNERAQQTASKVVLSMALMGIISTLLAFVLLIKYPNYIVNPIRELIDRIKKIANQNYDQRLEFSTGDEYEELAKAFNSMATRLQEYESSNLAKLKNEKQRIEAIINQMNEAVVGLDKNKNILFVNTKAEQLIGINRDDLVGKHAHEIASTNKLMQKLVRNLTKNQGENNRREQGPDLLKIVSDERHIYYSKETLPVIMNEVDKENKKQIGTIIALKNVTHFQEMNEAKTNFIAVVSHELKTPIASINMSLRLLKDERVGTLNEEQNELIDSVRNDTNRMKRTIAELLDLSKIESGNIQLNTQHAHPMDLLEYAYETMVMQAHQKSITIEINCDENLSPVKADLQKTVWVLVNLISNAIRYTSPKGKIKIGAENKPRAIYFSVIDNGKGIPEKYLEKIFQKYYQVHSDQIGSGGSGLGLAIAREFINAQGGEIGVDSEPEKGSTFFFTLPKSKI